MGFNWGGFAGGLSQGLVRGQALSEAMEDQKWKRGERERETSYRNQMEQAGTEANTETRQGLKVTGNGQEFFVPTQEAADAYKSAGYDYNPQQVSYQEVNAGSRGLGQYAGTEDPMAGQTASSYNAGLGGRQAAVARKFGKFADAAAIGELDMQPGKQKLQGLQIQASEGQLADAAHTRSRQAVNEGFEDALRGISIGADPADIEAQFNSTGKLRVDQGTLQYKPVTDKKGNVVDYQVTGMSGGKPFNYTASQIDGYLMTGKDREAARETRRWHDMQAGFYRNLYGASGGGAGGGLGIKDLTVSVFDADSGRGGKAPLTREFDKKTGKETYKLAGRELTADELSELQTTGSLTTGVGKESPYLSQWRDMETRAHSAKTPEDMDGWQQRASQAKLAHQTWVQNRSADPQDAANELLPHVRKGTLTADDVLKNGYSPGVLDFFEVDPRTKKLRLPRAQQGPGLLSRIANSPVLGGGSGASWNSMQSGGGLGPLSRNNGS